MLQKNDQVIVKMYWVLDKVYDSVREASESSKKSTKKIFINSDQI